MLKEPKRIIAEEPKQNAFWSAFFEPVFCKKRKVSFRQNGITIHPVLCIPDMDLHVST